MVASIDRDRQRALELAKPFVAFYAGFAQYHSYFDAHGFGREATELTEAARSERCREAARLVPDEMVSTFTACGTPDEVSEWIEPIAARAKALTILPPGWGLTAQEIGEKQAAIEAHLWPRR